MPARRVSGAAGRARRAAARHTSLGIQQQPLPVVVFMKTPQNCSGMMQAEAASASSAPAACASGGAVALVHLKHLQAKAPAQLARKLLRARRVLVRRAVRG